MIRWHTLLRRDVTEHSFLLVIVAAHSLVSLTFSRQNVSYLAEEGVALRAITLPWRLQQVHLSIPGEPCAPSKLRSILPQPPMQHASHCPTVHPPRQTLPED